MAARSCVLLYNDHVPLYTSQHKAFIDIRLRPGIATSPEEDQATATGNLHTKFREDRSSGSNPEICSDRQKHTHTDRQTDRNTPLSCQGGLRSNNSNSVGLQTMAETICRRYT